MLVEMAEQTPERSAAALSVLPVFLFFIYLGARERPDVIIIGHGALSCSLNEFRER